MNKAVFIDKDGTLIPDVPYNVDPALITLSAEAGESLRQFKAAGYLLIVISNQSGVAKGLFEEHQLESVRQRLNALLQAHGVWLDGFYYCPHWLEGTVASYAVDCDCRKPKAGMLLKAAQDFKLDLGQSWMIGDITTDSEAGKRAGCRAILIEKPYDPIIHLNADNQPDFIVSDWKAAQEIVLSEAKPMQTSYSHQVKE
jgi:D-glycero-D-manno-heptose 1,7-bisphosphate phosphatase